MKGKWTELEYRAMEHHADEIGLPYGMVYAANDKSFNPFRDACIFVGIVFIITVVIIMILI